MIGPVVPIRSGIAQHTTRLAAALLQLEEPLDLTLLSFRRQYPGWLFPGANERETAASTLQAPPAEFPIDGLAPWTWRSTAAQVRRLAPELVVIPWWTFAWAPCFRTLARGAESSGAHVRFLLHNVLDHEAAAWKSALTRSALSRGNSFVAHTRADAERLNALLPGRHVEVHPHPVYDQFPAPSRELPRRAPLELLLFGIIRKYKGLDLLIDALALLPDRRVHLRVVGEFWAGRAETERRIQALGLAEHVELVPRYVSEAEAADYFARADFVVLPYREASGSGVLAVATHYGKPVVATRVGGLPEAVVDGETGFLVEPGSARALADVLAGLDAGRAAEMTDAVKRRAAGMSWKGLAEVVARPPELPPTR